VLRLPHPAPGLEMPPGRVAAVPQAEETAGGCTKAAAESKPRSGTNPGHVTNFHFKLKKAPRQRNGHYLRENHLNAGKQ